jgi:hypothetical protein
MVQPILAQRGSRDAKGNPPRRWAACIFYSGRLKVALRHPERHVALERALGRHFDRAGGRLTVRWSRFPTVGRDDRSWPTRGEMQARFAHGADSSDDTSEVYAGSSGHSG